MAININPIESNVLVAVLEKKLTSQAKVLCTKGFRQSSFILLPCKHLFFRIYVCKELIHKNVR